MTRWPRIKIGSKKPNAESNFAPSLAEADALLEASGFVDADALAVA